MGVIPLLKNSSMWTVIKTVRGLLSPTACLLDLMCFNSETNVNCLHSAEMSRCVNLPDSYWCTVLYVFTSVVCLFFVVGSHWSSKLISGDSNETDLGPGGKGGWRCPHSKLNRPWDSHGSHTWLYSVNCALTYVCGTDAWNTAEGSLQNVNIKSHMTPHKS